MAKDDANVIIIHKYLLYIYSFYVIMCATIS